MTQQAIPTTATHVAIVPFWGGEENHYRDGKDLIVVSTHHDDPEDFVIRISNARFESGKIIKEEN